VVSSGDGDEFAAGASHDSLQVASELFIQRIIGRLEVSYHRALPELAERTHPPCQPFTRARPPDGG
jgi:hypothetical protein